jgi:hypothetical protein
MRPLNLPPAPPATTPFEQWVRDVLLEIERASQEADPGEIADNFEISGSLTKTRSINVSAPTAANAANVIATLIDDLKSRGPNVTGT